MCCFIIQYKQQFGYDVIPYVSTAVFPESHLSVIQICSVLTTPQSLSYRQSAGPGKYSKH